MADRPKNLTLQDTLANQSGRHKRRKNMNGLQNVFAWIARASVLLAVLIAPWMIGSVSNLAQLIISILLLLGLASWWIDSALSAGKKQIVPYLALFLLLGLGIGLLQTTALPDSMINLMGGKQIELAETYQTGQDDLRLTMNLPQTWNQIRLLIIALSGLLLGCRYFRTSAHLSLFLTANFFNAIALGVFGLLQKFRFNGMLYWYIELNQGGTPFGPFVNRNNAAGYLVMGLAAGAGLFMYLLHDREESRPHIIVSKEIPIWRQVSTYLGIFISKLNATNIAVLVGLFFVGLTIVATLSRGGVLAMLSAVIGGTLIFCATRKPKFGGLLMAPVAVLFFCLASWFGFGEQIISRFESIDTLSDKIDARFNSWNDTLPAAFEHGWVGAGLGSYRSVHRQYRSDQEVKIFEYAENQYIQTLVEAGLPGFVILIGAITVALWLCCLLLTRGSSAGSIGSGVFGSILLAGQLVAAGFDFGWYIPANMLLMAVSLGVVSSHAHALAARLKKKSWLRWEPKKYISQTVTIVAFLCCMFVVVDLYRKHQIDKEMNVSVRNTSFDTLNKEETVEKINRIVALAKNSPTVRVYNLLGDLHVHLARLNYYEAKQQDPMIVALKEEMISSESLWALTSLVRMHEDVGRLRAQSNLAGLRNLMQTEFLRVDLPAALGYYNASLRLFPYQPAIQLRDAQLSFLLESKEDAIAKIEKCIALSPRNGQIRYIAAVNLMQNESPELAIEHLNMALDINPEQFFERVVKLCQGRSNRRVPTIRNQVIAEDVIGDRPRLLYLFASEWLKGTDRLRISILERADSLIDPTEISLSDSETLKLKANINFGKGDWEQGVKYLEDVVRSNPNDHKTRFRLAKVLVENGLYRQAKEHLESLIRSHGQQDRYIELQNTVKDAIRRNDLGSFDEPSSYSIRTSTAAISEGSSRG